MLVKSYYNYDFYQTNPHYECQWIYQKIMSVQLIISQHCEMLWISWNLNFRSTNSSLTDDLKCKCIVAIKKNYNFLEVFYISHVTTQNISFTIWCETLVASRRKVIATCFKIVIHFLIMYLKYVSGFFSMCNLKISQI